MSDDYLYVEPDRVRALATTMSSGADAVGAIHVDQQAGAVSGAVPGTGVGAACSEGALSAATAIEATVQQVRAMASATTTGLATVVSTDQHNAVQFPPGK
ncbi:hypothetical protein [Nocardia sp. NPDC056000]|uniref:hypothetical protein n=1 Tax=Nocardia sp. NPDC056000 TaxID=3345674 RepID=UPI0035DE95BB